MFKKFLFYMILFSVSSSLLPAAAKEESLAARNIKKSKEDATNYYNKNIINLNPKEKSIILELIYYILKYKNADSVIRNLLGKFGQPPSKEEETVLDTWKGIRNKINEFNRKKLRDVFARQYLPDDDRSGYSNNRVLKIMDDFNFDILYISPDNIIQDFNFYEELYTRLYNDIKNKKPELLVIKFGDDAGKPFPLPEKLTPNYWFPIHGFEDYKRE